ncbi:uncharacterized protein LOC142629130 [Castanea sativa]|uniref:uncharacterized protein LOC142629130 n=1 Tax=Castanea sativa TaxID=21020 RepID=UPI003F64AF06
MSVQGGFGDEAVEGGNQLAKRMKLSETPILGFSEEDKEGTCQPHDDALVVTIRIRGYDVKQVLVDDGSGAEIMYPDLFNGLNLKVEDLEKYDSLLVGFDGKPVIPQGIIRLPVQVEDEEVQVNFIVVKAYSPYTAILARPWLHAMGAVSSTLHVKFKYPIRERQLKKPALGLGADLDRDLAKELNRVFIGEDKERYFQVGSQLPAFEKVELFKFLKANIDVFACTMYDVSGIDPKFICHQLNVNPEAMPRRQPPRRASQEHAEAVKEELGRNMEADIDDMVIKSKRVEDHLLDLEEAFSVLRKHKLRLNASKCSFGVSSGKFLGYIITHQGIEVNPNQIKAIMGLHPPRNPKEVQRLTGMTTALNRFISRSGDRCRPFYHLLHKWRDFQWTDECDLAFEDLKQYLANPPILSRPEKEEVLYAYLAITDYAALMRKSDYTGRVAKWGTRLRAYDVKYMPWTAIKGQVLVDFVAEFMEGAGIGIVLITPKKLIMEKSLRLGFVATNNEAEHEALLTGAQMVRHLGGEVVEFYCDSRLVVGQVNGEFEARDERMKRYLNRVKGVLSMFKNFKVRQIPRGQNAHADSLAMLATSLGSKLPQTVMVEDLMSSSLAGIPTVGIHSI